MSETTIPRAGIIGHPVAQSRSPMLHRYWLEQLGIAGSYDRIDVPPDGFEAFIATFLAEGFVGGNVTAPHKLAAYKAMAQLDEAAASIGAVNTIWVADGKLVGGNTDAHGFIANLDERAPDWQKPGINALVLGAGGASRAALFALKARGRAITLANRTRATAEALAAHFKDSTGPAIRVIDWDDLAGAMENSDLLVNTTVLGMLGKHPLELDLTPLKPGATVYDIVYVPLETALLKAARLRGHRTVDGLGMLLHQAVPAFARWFGQTPTVTQELRALIEADIRAKSPGA